MSETRMTPEREREIRAYVQSNADVVALVSLGGGANIMHRNEREITFMAVELLRALDEARATIATLTRERDGLVAGYEQALENAARDIDALTRELNEATKVDPTSRSHECRACRGGLRKPLQECPDCCGTAIEGTGLRRQVSTLTRDLAAAQREREELIAASREAIALGREAANRSIQARKVTDEKVERMAQAMGELKSDVPWRMWSEYDRDEYRTLARRALTAALAPTPGAEEARDA